VIILLPGDKAGLIDGRVQMCTDEKGRDWTRGFSLPFKESLLLRTMKTLHIPLEWLVMRSNDIGTCYVDGSIHTDRSKHPSWSTLPSTQAAEALLMPSTFRLHHSNAVL
jgi:hypothetical protein